MLKVTPFFPLSTKDKHTSTCSNFMNHKFTHEHTSNSWNLQTQTKQKPQIDFSRLAKLSEPRLTKQKQTQLTQTNSHFYTLHKRSYEKQNALPFCLNKINQKPSKKLFNQSPHSQVDYSKNSLFLNYSKMSLKKASQINLKTEQNKGNPPIPMLTLRKIKTQKCKTLLNESISIFKNCKLKERKKEVFDPQTLKSSDLASIYSSLYNKYEVVPFDEIEEREPVLINLQENTEKEREIEKSQKLIKKERKSFGMKTLEFEKNLRKEIKSLTRDTDHILSLQFRDIRQVNIR